MEFYIKKINSNSEYFAREDNGNNPNVTINISMEDELGNETPKHLIITGINGTGKTVLLDSVDDVLRKKYIDITGNVISTSPNKSVSTQLVYCDTCLKYFEPVFVTAEHMFKPSKGLDNNDFVNLIFEISKYSKPLMSSLEKSLTILYDDDYEGIDTNACEIKLKNRPSFSIRNMSSGHYSFLNIFSCIKFRKLTLKWENRNLWEFMYKELLECLTLSDNIVNKFDDHSSSHTTMHSRKIKHALVDEKNCQKNIKNALEIVQSRLDASLKNGSAERSRSRDEDLILYLSRAKQVSEYELYLKEQNVQIWLEIAHQKEMLNGKISKCFGMLLNCEHYENDSPLIILIDEPEIHLHVALQKRVLPYLEKCFPNAQFIVATHSPFVITSLKNATLFNLGNGETLNDDLTRYSYKNVIEEWFDIYSCSEEAKNKYAEFRKLAESDKKLSTEEIEKYINLYSYLIKTDLIGTVSILNSQKQIRDGEIYVLRAKEIW